MLEKNEVTLTAEQEELIIEVEEFVLSAVSARCADCSTAHFEPGRIAGVIARGRLPKEAAIAVAERFEACPGFDEMCHYRSPRALSVAASTSETPQPPILH